MTLNKIVVFFSKRKYIFTPLVFFIPLVAIFLIVNTPINQTFEYKPMDEGIELMRAMLFLNGSSFYREIISDQPPLFTLLLSYWFRLLRPSVYFGRVLVLILSGILLYSFYVIIKNVWGRFCGTVAVIFLLLSALYLRLSISIMLAIPPFSFAMLSILSLMLYKKSKKVYLLLLSGIFFALSLHIKLITLFLVPVIIFEIVQTNWISLKDKKLIRFLPPLFLWLGSLCVVFFIILFIFFDFDFSLIFQQLIKPHLNKANIPSKGLLVIKRVFEDYDIVLLSLIGIILIIKQKRWNSLFPILWLIVSIFILIGYKPIWENYYLLLSIPISWLAAITFTQFFINIRNKEILKTNKFIFFLTGVIVILTILRVPHKLQRTYESIKPPTERQNWEAVNRLLEYRPYIHWILTDEPMFAFYARALTPPELTLIDQKRNFTGPKEQDYCIEKLRKYRPEIIILRQIKFFGPKVISYIKKNYPLRYSYQTETMGNVRIFIHRESSEIK